MSCCCSVFQALANQPFNLTPAYREPVPLAPAGAG